MPRDFYPDIDQYGKRPDEKNCLHEISMWDGPGICMRPKGHPVTDTSKYAVGEAPEDAEFHQEAFEGWIWDNNGRVS